MEPTRINLLLFGACREIAGVGELTCELEGPADVAAAWVELQRRFPGLAGFDRSILFAVNEEHAQRTHPLGNGDTLAIFPPVSGG